MQLRVKVSVALVTSAVTQAVLTSRALQDCYSDSVSSLIIAYSKCYTLKFS